jgi:predicted RND superfamily exporter protein
MEALYRFVEEIFAGLARVIYRHPLPPLLLVAVATLTLAMQLPKLVLDTSNESFFHANSPELLNYVAFKEEFGREDMIIIATETDNVFDPAFLSRLESLHKALEARVPHLDEVTSLLNARNTRGEGDELIVEDLFESWPQTSDDMAALRDRALSNPIYRNLLLSDDGRVTAVVVRPSPYAVSVNEVDILAGFDDEPAGDSAPPAEFLNDRQTAEFVAVTREIVQQFHSDDFRLRVGGMPVMTEVLKDHMRQDMARFLLAAVAGITLLLYVMFRRVSGVVIPLLTIILTLVCTLGLMGFTGIAFKVPTQILPSFLIAVGVGSSVHVLSQFYWRFDAGDERPDALTGALRQSGAPVLGAALTTAVGLMSFSNASLAPLAEMGIFAGAGILISLLYTLILIPALLAIVPITRKPPLDSRGKRMDRFLEACADFAIRHRRANMVAAGVITLLSVLGLTRLEFEHNPLEWFPVDHSLRTDIESLNESLKGVMTMELVIDTGEENGLYSPTLLQNIDSMARDVKAIEHRGMSTEKVLSLVDVLKEINLALNADQPEHYSIPDNRELVAQELFLFENTGTDDLEDFVDSQFRKARYTVKLPWMGSTIIYGYGEALLDTVIHALPENINAQVTGIGMLFASVAVKSLHSIRESYLLAAVVISILMVFFIGDLRVGLAAMIPNLSPILISLGLLGWSGIPLNVFTMFVGSIALGLAVDDTLHFLHGFKRAHMETGSTEAAIKESFRSTGRALVVTTVALSMGFFLFAFATMQSVMLFGLLTGCTIVLALVADFIVMPAILTWIISDRHNALPGEAVEEVEAAQ